MVLLNGSINNSVNFHIPSLGHKFVPLLAGLQTPLSFQMFYKLNNNSSCEEINFGLYLLKRTEMLNFQSNFYIYLEIFLVTYFGTSFF